VSHLFNKEYYLTSCGIPYSDDGIKNHHEVIAEHIVRDFNPKTVLDAGCAYGYIVAALRDRGVNAYGIDISNYAISQVREDIRPYCVAGSIIDPLPVELPQRYDLIINIEILEHLYEEDSIAALVNLCKYGDKIVFSSSPVDVTEKTHYNVQQIEYWSKHFAKENFFRVLDYSPNYITPWAVYFERSSLPLYRIVENYEHKFRNILNTLRQGNEALQNLQAENNSLQAENVTQYQYFVSSRSWKITRPLRAIKQLITKGKS